MHCVQAAIVQIAPIHDVEGPGLDGQDIQHVDIVHLAVADVNEAGNAAAQMRQSRRSLASASVVRRAA